MKKAKECGFDGKSGGKENAGDNRSQATEEDHCPMSPVGDHVQDPLPPPQHSNEGGYLCTVASAKYYK